MSRLVRSVLGLLLGGMVALTSGPAAVHAASTDPSRPAFVLTPADAVARLMTLINQDRSAAGLVAYQPDPRLMSIAAARAETMATSGLFGHQGPDGQTVFDIIQAERITWYGAGEVIAWDSWADLADSVNAANTGWMGSPVHRDLLLAGDENYFGVGLATAADGRHYWATELMRGPDRTGPWARLTGATSSRTSSAASVRVTWTGADVPLVVLTAGLRDFQIQRRADLGGWVGVSSATTQRSWTLTLPPGHRYEFRVRARDRAGNYGAWSAPTSVSA